MVRKLIFAAVLVLCSTMASAQETGIINPAYRRAQMLVNDGNAAAGRAIVDSMIAAAAPGSTDYAEAVYWRAVLAATAADAEMDYRRVIVDFPASPRFEDALIRLAQLEIARGNNDGAVRHLGRLATERPESPARARAGYWMARALFEKNDVQAACAATADALARTKEGDAELRNQIAYLNQRCAGVVLTPPAQTTSTEAGAPPATVTSPVVPAAVPVVTPPRDSAVAVTVPPRDTVRTVAPAPAPAPIPAPPPAARPASSRPATGGSWSVQIAAYNQKAQADAMVARLKRNGYEARVDGTSAPFRVRIGRYATPGQASAVQRSLKAKQLEGFVVQTDTQ